jgi:midasin
LTDKAYYLSEELRNIFKPTKISGMKGDFRTGKRINMRKVISYVASNYRKDKIWLRRSDPSQKDYQIILGIDDSLSMNEKNVGYFALEALTTFAIALNKLEVGEIMISAIRNGMTELHPFNKPFSPSEGPKLISNMGFNFSDQVSADFGLAKFMRESIDAFSKDERHKICFIISDGRFNKDVVRPFCLESEEAGILYIYIILDSSDKKSILNYRTSKVEKVNGKTKVSIKNYLEDFPFRNYIIVRDMRELTGIIASIMRDYFMKMDM